MTDPRALAIEALHFNNSLVQFADQKAATLIVINSIYIASAGAPTGPLAVACLIFSVCSLLCCLLVIRARRDPIDREATDLVFFGDILQHKHGRGYYASLVATPPERIAEGIAARVFRTCTIARRKYRCYGWALRLSLAAAPLWIAVMLTGRAR
jgi:hypothetical protein